MDHHVKCKEKIIFTKMHGAGNDYIYIDGMHRIPEDLSDLARKMSDYHFGIGSDGLVVITRSDVADFRMRMFNSDGSEAEMCGNASRCVGKYVFDRGLTEKKEVTLETLAGIKVLHLHVVDGSVESVTVDMGRPVLKAADVPAISRNGEKMIHEECDFGDMQYNVTAVGMGNPHCVIFVDEVTDCQVLGHGPVIEKSTDIFPKKTNVEFARVADRQNIEMRVWERGTGETFACGTGACATAVAAREEGLVDESVTLHLRGGDLRIEWSGDPEDHVFMTGPAKFVCDGVFYRY